MELYQYWVCICHRSSCGSLELLYQYKLTCVFVPVAGLYVLSMQLISKFIEEWVTQFFFDIVSFYACVQEPNIILGMIRIAYTESRIVPLNAGQTILLVLHGGVLNACYRHAMGRTYAGRHINAAINTVKIDGKSWAVIDWMILVILATLGSWHPLLVVAVEEVD